MKVSKLKKVFFIALLLRLVLIFISGYHPDIINHVDWGEKVWQYGAKDFYEQIFWRLSWPNQPLGSMCLFAFIAKLFKLVYSVLWWLNLKIAIFPSFIFSFVDQKLHIVLLKLPFILADIGIGWLIYQIVLKITKKKSQALFGSLIFLFNPVSLYNSAVWGQTDSLTNFLALFGIWQLYQKNFFRGCLGILLSLYFKLSLIIWLPIAFLIVWFQKKEWKKIAVNFFIVMFFLLAISFPFVHHGNLFTWLWYLYTNRVLPRQGDMLSGNAFNFWNLIYGIDLSLGEGIAFLGMTAKTFGRLLTAFLALIPTIFFVKKKKNNFTDFLWLMLFYSFASFLFLTNMHERYLYPVFAPLAVLVSTGKVKLRWYLILSLIHLLNLYNLWWYPRIAFLQNGLEWNNFFLTRVFSLLLILIFGLLFYTFWCKRNEKTILKRKK